MSNNTHNANYWFNDFIISINEAVVKTMRKQFLFQLLEKELLRIHPDRLSHEKTKELLKCLYSMGI